MMNEGSGGWRMRDIVTHGEVCKSEACLMGKRESGPPDDNIDN